jgi:hypothetical protein
MEIFLTQSQQLMFSREERHKTKHVVFLVSQILENVVLIISPFKIQVSRPLILVGITMTAITLLTNEQS